MNGLQKIIRGTIPSAPTPEPTATLSLKLKADSGYNCTATQRITLAQWTAINAILNATTESGDAQ